MNEKKRVIIFGTGWAFNNYTSNYADEYEVIGVTDWNYQKHGNEIKGYKVINPYMLKEIKYDKILILSYYARQIKEQLFKKCGIEEDEIIVPPKYKVKGRALPFEDPDTMQLAHDIIIYFNRLAKEINIKLFLELGTLLGIVRDGGVIAWDDDIDLSINEEDVFTFYKAILSIRDCNELPFSELLEWSLTIKQDPEGKTWYFSFNFKNRNSVSFRDFEVGIGVRKFFKSMSVLMRGNYYSCPMYHFDECEFINFNNQKVCVPKDYQKYLDLLYGDWKEPKMLSFGVKYGEIKDTSKDKLKTELKNVLVF